MAGKATISANALKTGIYARKWRAVTGDEQYMANHLVGELRPSPRPRSSALAEVLRRRRADASHDTLWTNSRWNGRGA